jgi:hypothetical protein
MSGVLGNLGSRAAIRRFAGETMSFTEEARIRSAAGSNGRCWRVLVTVRQQLHVKPSESINTADHVTRGIIVTS